MSTPPVTPELLEFKLGDGSVVKAPNMEEAFKQVAKMKEDTAAALKVEKEKAATAENERQRLEGELNRRAKPAPTNGTGPQFDKQHYYDLLNSDPIEAHEYISAFHSGLKPGEYRPAIAQMQQDVSVMRQNMIANQFTQQHMEDYPMGDATAARLMTQRVEDLTRQGYPFDVRTMNLAWSELVSEGAVKPNVPSAAGEEETPRPNPNLQGGGGQVITESELQRIESMSDKELEAFLRANGKLG